MEEKHVCSVCGIESDNPDRWALGDGVLTEDICYDCAHRIWTSALRSIDSEIEAIKKEKKHY